MNLSSRIKRFEANFARLLGRGMVLIGAVVAALAVGDAALGQIPLPTIRVDEPKQAPKRTAAVKRAAAPRPAAVRSVVATPLADPAREVASKNQAFDRARDETILPKLGTNVANLDRAAIEALPQGANTPVDKVLLQFPGVSQDSAASGAFHVRNEHGNVQYRINGILLPEGIGGLGQVLETSFIGNIALITGALPAQYGFHTAGLVDITSKNFARDPGGSISIYGGSRQTITPSIEYGGVIGQTEYFFTGRYLTNSLGIENTTGSLNAIHDRTQQGKFFGYASTPIDDTTRVSVITGHAVSKFQIPAIPGKTPNFCSNPDPTICPTTVNFTAGDTFDSAAMNENQIERTDYGVFAVQKRVNDIDLQVAYFSRYTSIHFTPDPIGDLAFNGVAANVMRSSFLNGIQSDAAYRLNEAHTLRFGTIVSGERTEVVNSSVVFGGGANPSFANDPMLPCFTEITCTVVDRNAKVGWLFGAYIQDEWRLSDVFTLNLGLRFDQMDQFVNEKQISPRASLIFKPTDSTTWHVAYARNFTPPPQIIAGPTNFALFTNTPQAPEVTTSDPVRAERSHVFDAGVVQKLWPGVEVGVTGYYKIARNLLDDGQFGQALVLTGFNYDRGENYGVEGKIRYQDGNFRAYANVAWAIQKATNVVSNQFLFSQADLTFIANNWIFTDHAQTWTGSAGVSYLCAGTRFSADMFFGSGLRRGDHNSEHMPFYTQVNAGISHEFKVPDRKPMTLRFDVVNVFDNVYGIRDGSGIGVFAPQFGPRRAYLMGLSQKL